MTPTEALERQIHLYRQMTGEERVGIALDLHEFACEISREGIRRQFPEATREEIDHQLRRRIELGRQ